MKYKIGQIINYNGIKYQITDIQKDVVPMGIRKNKKLVCVNDANQKIILDGDCVYE